MKIAGVLLLAAVLLAGCGASVSTKAMDAKFAKVDYDMASVEDGKTPGEHLEKLTRQYIALDPRIRRPAWHRRGQAPSGGEGDRALAVLPVVHIDARRRTEEVLLTNSRWPSFREARE